MKNRNTRLNFAIPAILAACIFGPSHPLCAQQAEQALPPATPQAQTGNPAAPPGQSAPSAPAQPVPAPAQPGENPVIEKVKPSSTTQSSKDDRIFFALPNYLTVENGNKLPPLSTKMKFKTVAEGCFDPVEVVFIGIQAGLGQADKTNPTYGQGFVGYSKRFGTAYADAIIGNFGTGAIFPTLLHQDPRYYTMGSGNVFRRMGHAGFRVIITKSDSGKTQFNFSELLGNGMAAGLSNAYHPAPHTIASSTNVLGTQVLLDALGYELKEFWPDIRRQLLRGKHKT